MGQENGAPGRARTAPARTVPQYGLRWRARDAWRGLRWRARERPLWVIGVIWCTVGALMILSSFTVPGAGLVPACFGAVVSVFGVLACQVKRRWRR
jgi:hypothetical protein